MARPPASEQIQVNFRMPADLKARIEAAAEANNRTTTAELVAALEEKFPPPALHHRELVDALQQYVLRGEGEDEMRERAKEANNVLSGFEETKSYKIMVLDEIGAKAVREKVVVGKVSLF